jgi:hypothetical protein
LPTTAREGIHRLQRDASGTVASFTIYGHRLFAHTGGRKWGNAEAITERIIEVCGAHVVPDCLAYCTCDAIRTRYASGDPAEVERITGRSDARWRYGVAHESLRTFTAVVGPKNLEVITRDYGRSNDPSDARAQTAREGLRRKNARIPNEDLKCPALAARPAGWPASNYRIPARRTHQSGECRIIMASGVYIDARTRGQHYA